MAAGEPLDGILTDRRRRSKTNVWQRLRAQSAASTLGIEVAELTLLDVHPPRPVVAAYPTWRTRSKNKSRTRQRGGRVLRRSAVVESPVSGPSDFSDATARLADSGSTQRPTGGVSGWTLTDHSGIEAGSRDADTEHRALRRGGEHSLDRALKRRRRKPRKRHGGKPIVSKNCSARISLSHS